MSSGFSMTRTTSLTGWAAVPARDGSDCWYVNLTVYGEVYVERGADGAPLSVVLFLANEEECECAPEREPDYSAEHNDLTHLVETLDALTGHYRAGRRCETKGQWQETEAERP